MAKKIRWTKERRAKFMATIAHNRSMGGGQAPNLAPIKQEGQPIRWATDDDVDRDRRERNVMHVRSLLKAALELLS